MSETSNYQTRTVAVLLSQDFRATCRGYDPAVEYKEVLTLTVDGTGSDHEAAEVAYAVCNSYPEEMHCPASYRQVVATYRRFQYRSLSVGDAVVIGGTTYAVADFGFEAVAS